MKVIHCAAQNVLRDIVRSQAQHTSLPPAFLIPAFASQQKSFFSTSVPASARARKDGNTRRGMSPLKRTGFNKRFKLSVNIEDLPKPVLDPALRTKVQTDPDHGLWEFFDKDKSGLITPEALNEHGRAWAVPELRRKDFDDLWKLWWVCVKEVNRVKTYEAERARLKIGYGQHEAEVRLTETKRTMKSIRQALTERWHQFDSARELAMYDPEINLYANSENGESVYTPGAQAADEVENDQVAVHDGTGLAESTLGPKSSDLREDVAGDRQHAQFDQSETTHSMRSHPQRTSKRSKDRGIVPGFQASTLTDESKLDVVTNKAISQSIATRKGPQVWYKRA